MQPWWRRGLRGELTRLRREGRESMEWSLRVTVVATAAYVVGLLIFPGTQPLLASLTAMLVVQVTPVSLLASGLDRVIAVVAGVSLAVGFSAVVPLHWWSLAVLIFVSLVMGQLLRLRSNLIEVAISGILVLGVGVVGAEAAAWQRITETLVGAVVGVAVNLLVPPKVASGDAGRAIDGLANDLSELLNRSGSELDDLVAGDGDLSAAAAGWLEDAREINLRVPQVISTLARAEEGRRFNVRAVGRADVGPGLRQGLEALEHCSVAIRGAYRGLVDALRDGGWLDDEIAPDVLLGLAQTLHEMAAGVDAFGALVRDEADPSVKLSAADVGELSTALEGLHEAQARLQDLMLFDVPPALGQLNSAVLAAVRRLMHEMDLDRRMRQQVRLARRPPPRPTLLGRPSAPGRPSPSGRPPAPGRPAEPRRFVRPGPHGEPESHGGRRRPADRDDADRPEPTPDAETQVLPAQPQPRRPGRPR